MAFVMKGRPLTVQGLIGHFLAGVRDAEAEMRRAPCFAYPVECTEFGGRE